MKNIKFNYPDRKIIGIRNYKILKGNAKIEIAPITILTGTNSSGKSSIIESIKLIAKNFNNPSRNFKEFEHLKFQNPDLQLGSFESRLNSYANKQELSFKTNFYSELIGNAYIELTYIKDIHDKFKGGLLKSIHIFKEDKDDTGGTNVQSILKISENLNKNRRWELKINSDQITESFRENIQIGYIQHIIDVLGMHKYESSDGSEVTLKEPYMSIHRFLEKNEIEVGMLIDFSYNFKLREKQNKSYYRNSIADDLFRLSNYYKKKPDFLVNSIRYLNRKLDVFYFLNFPLFNYIDIIELEESVLKLYPFLEANISDKRLLSPLISNLINSGVKDKNDFYIHIKKLESTFIEYLITRKMDEDSVFHGHNEELYGNKMLPKKSDWFNTSLERFLEHLFNWKTRKHFVYMQFVDLLHLSKEEKHFVDSVLKNSDQVQGVGESTDLLYDQISNLIKESFNAFKAYSDFIIIDSARIKPQRLYFDEDISYFNKLLQKFLHQEYENNNSENYSHLPSLSFIRKYLRKFDIADDFIVERPSEGLGSRVYLINGSTKELLADVGYGINKLFPILFQIVLATRDSTIFIEEPESNLHPNLQSLFSDMLVDAHNRFRHKFVLETHSEYLIRKLQYLVAEPNTKISDKDINIYYLSNPDEMKEGDEQVRLINIRPDGGLTGAFGSGFVDESINLKIELLRAKKFGKN